MACFRNKKKIESKRAKLKTERIEIYKMLQVISHHLTIIAVFTQLKNPGTDELK